MNTRDCVDDAVVKCVGEIESLCKEQYHKLKKEVLDSRSESIHAPITKNKLSLFSTWKSKAKQLADLRNNVAIFGRLYIANQRATENQKYFSDMRISYIFHPFQTMLPWEPAKNLIRSIVVTYQKRIQWKRSSIVRYSIEQHWYISPSQLQLPPLRNMVKKPSLLSYRES